MNLLSLKNNFLSYSKIKSNLIFGKLNSTSPVYSILIPTYKRTDFLKQAIDSALNQDKVLNYEIIVVDNDPNHNNEVTDILNSYNAKNLFYYKNEVNIGMIGNWNRCVELARGKWITFLHDDDLLFPEYLSSMHNILQSLPNIELLAPGALSGTEMNYNLVKKYLSKSKIYQLNISDFFFQNPVPTQATMFLKKNCIKLGGFSEEDFPCSDYVFWINYVAHFEGYKLSENLFFYRIFDNESRKSETIIQIIKAEFSLRKELIKFINNPLLFTESYNKMFFLHNIDMSNKYKNTSIDKNKLSIEYNISKIWDVYLIKKICIKLALCIIMYSTKNRMTALQSNFKNENIR